MKKTVHVKTAGNKPGVIQTSTRDDKELTAGLLADVRKQTAEGNGEFVVVGFDPYTMERLRMAAAYEADGDVTAWIRGQITDEDGDLGAFEEGREYEAEEVVGRKLCDGAKLSENSPFRKIRLGQYRRWDREAWLRDQKEGVPTGSMFALDAENTRNLHFAAGIVGVSPERLLNDYIVEGQLADVRDPVGSNVHGFIEATKYTNRNGRAAAKARAAKCLAID